MKRCELLAPAGDHDCFLAAASAGADAVYLGLDRFSARASANNFTGQELLRALDIAHIRGIRIYLTVNTLFKDDELPALYDMLYEPYINGLDAVIVQDIGAMKMIRSCFPDLPIHASTQAAITSADGALYLADLGITRVVPARELSLKEIIKFKEETGLELECFIHGSMCYSYSGKCLLSSFIGGRSGNRGRCAQPCRLTYDDEYLLSLSDLCCVEMIPELINAGISSFKIEGRAKSPAYVHNVTSIYRKYIDEYYENNSNNVDPLDVGRLVNKYSRGKTGTGYYRLHNDRKMITLDFPSYVVNEDEKGSAHNTGSVPLTMSVDVKQSERVKIELSSCTKTVTYISDVLPDDAKNAPITEKSVKKQFSKLGDTVFTAKDIKISVDDGLFIPNGILNNIRREAVKELTDCILKDHKRSGDSVRFAKEELSDTNPHPGDRPVVHAQVINIKQAETVLETDADALIIPFYIYSDLTKDIRARLRGKKFYVTLPVIVREEDKDNSPSHIKELLDILSSDKDVEGIYISNLESAKLAGKSSFSGKIIGDIYLYAYNRCARNYLIDHGTDNTTVPVELNLKDLKKRGITGEDLIVYGRLPMMISANCIINTKNGCRFDKKGHETYITDRKGMKMFVSANCRECTNVLYNSVKLCLTDDRQLFDVIHPSSIRFIFTDEDPGMIRKIMSDYYAKRDETGVTFEPVIPDYTRGHINRGIE